MEKKIKRNMTKKVDLIFNLIIRLSFDDHQHGIILILKQIKSLVIEGIKSTEKKTFALKQMLAVLFLVVSQKLFPEKKYITFSKTFFRSSVAQFFVELN